MGTATEMALSPTRALHRLDGRGQKSCFQLSNTQHRFHQLTGLITGRELSPLSSTHASEPGGGLLLLTSLGLSQAAGLPAPTDTQEGYTHTDRDTQTNTNIQTRRHTH